MKVIVPNAYLINKPITNVSRSGSITIFEVFDVGYRTTREQLIKLEEKVLAYVKRHPVDWKPDIWLRINSGSVTGNLQLKFGVNHLRTWGDSGDFWSVRGKFVHAVIKYMIVSAL